jgi:diacylglycerol kinase family enzyme
MKQTAVDSFCVGAIGLGSSNDTHKPLDRTRVIRGIPVRIHASAAKPVDIIRVEYRNSEGTSAERFCLNNASIGITAEANAFFNLRRAWMRVVQRFSVNAAVMAAAVKTMLAYRAIPCRLCIDEGRVENVNVTNLGVVKNLHFAGSLRYDTAVERDDGILGVNLCHDLSPVETAGILAALGRGRFCGRKKTRQWKARGLTIESRQRFALEMDGEVVETRFARFNVVPRAIRWCA